jgi:hypothetical protein
MAGSLGHCLNEDGTYRGTELLENMGDMGEAVDELMFIVLSVRARRGGRDLIEQLSSDYYACKRKERAWPAFMHPGID